MISHLYRRNSMKRTRGKVLFILLVFILSVSVLTGCGEDKSGSTIDEPEITTDYLTDEYADQLTTDGAETILGLVVLEKSEDSSYTAHIREQEIVLNSSYDEGYYIADTNVTVDAVLGMDARMTCIIGGKTQVVTADEFIRYNGEDSQQLYSIYMMGDSAELILAVDPESITADTK